MDRTPTVSSHCLVLCFLHASEPRINHKHSKSCPVRLFFLRPSITHFFGAVSASIVATTTVKTLSSSQWLGTVIK